MSSVVFASRLEMDVRQELLARTHQTTSSVMEFLAQRFQHQSIDDCAKLLLAVYKVGRDEGERWGAQFGPDSQSSPESRIEAPMSEAKPNPTALERLRVILDNGKRQKPDSHGGAISTLISIELLELTIQEIEHLRSVAGAVSQGESFADLKKAAR